MSGLEQLESFDTHTEDIHHRPWLKTLHLGLLMGPHLNLRTNDVYMYHRPLLYDDLS